MGGEAGLEHAREPVAINSERVRVGGEPGMTKDPAVCVRCQQFAPGHSHSICRDMTVSVSQSVSIVRYVGMTRSNFGGLLVARNAPSPSGSLGGIVCLTGRVYYRFRVFSPIRSCTEAVRRTPRHRCRFGSRMLALPLTCDLKFAWSVTLAGPQLAT